VITCKFCLVPDGFSSISARLYEVIIHGCIPVLITEAFHPPFEHFLNWNLFAIFIKREQIPMIEELLKGIDYQRYHRELRRVAHALDLRTSTSWTLLMHSLQHTIIESQCS